MSEFTEEGKLPSVNVTDENSKVLKEKLADTTEFAEIAVSSELLVNNMNNSGQSGGTCNNRDSDVTIKYDQKSDLCCSSVENAQFSSSPATSTPVTNRVVAVDSSHISDTTPLLGGRHSSVSSCTDVTTEGETSETSCDCSCQGSRDSDSSSSNTMLTASQTRENLMVPGTVRVPIVGHETLESRTKFTVSCFLFSSVQIFSCVCGWVGQLVVCGSVGWSDGELVSGSVFRLVDLWVGGLVG